MGQTLGRPAARRNLGSVERKPWMAEERGKKVLRLPRRKEKVMIQLAVAQRSGRNVNCVGDPFSAGRGTHTMFRMYDQSARLSRPDVIANTPSKAVAGGGVGVQHPFLSFPNMVLLELIRSPQSGDAVISKQDMPRGPTRSATERLFSN